MDLSILIQDTVVYIRVAGIIETPKGFLFEKSKDNYLRALGGKIMLNETSKEAIKRELAEEIGMRVSDLFLCSIIENIYTKGDEKVHEICFVYKIENIFEGTLAANFVEVPMGDINKFDIRPSSIVDVLQNKRGSFKHIIQQ